MKKTLLKRCRACGKQSDRREFRRLRYPLNGSRWACLACYSAVLRRARERREEEARFASAIAAEAFPEINLSQ